MKKFITILASCFVFCSFSFTYADTKNQTYICVDGIEFFIDDKVYDPPKTEKMEMLIILQNSGITNAIVNFYNQEEYSIKFTTVKIVNVRNSKVYERSGNKEEGYPKLLRRAVTE